MSKKKTTGENIFRITFSGMVSVTAGEIWPDDTPVPDNPSAKDVVDMMKGMEMCKTEVVEELNLDEFLIIGVHGVDGKEEWRD